MTRSRQPVPQYVPPTYEDVVATFERRLQRLIAEVSAMKSEDELTRSHDDDFSSILSMAKVHLCMSKEELIEAFAPLNTKYVCCVDNCPASYKRTGIWAEKFGDEEVLVSFSLKGRSAAAEWVIDHGHKVGYTPAQIEKARIELKGLRRQRLNVAWR